MNNNGESCAIFHDEPRAVYPHGHPGHSFSNALLLFLLICFWRYFQDILVFFWPEDDVFNFILVFLEHLLMVALTLITVPGSDECSHVIEDTVMIAQLGRFHEAIVLSDEADILLVFVIGPPAKADPGPLFIKHIPTYLLFLSFAKVKIHPFLLHQRMIFLVILQQRIYIYFRYAFMSQIRNQLLGRRDVRGRGTKLCEFVESGNKFIFGSTKTSQKIEKTNI